MKKRILFIEDDPFLGDVLTQKLIYEGYDTILVQDGAEGLKQMRLQKPDLVLLDMILPTMNGYQIIEESKKDTSLSSIPIIIVSNSGQPVEIDRALALGVKDYLLKAQMDPEEVLTKIRACIGESDVKQDTSKTRLANKKILLVEDDQFLSNILCIKLGHEGSIGLYAKDGKEAFAILEREIPDIILLDLLLPDKSGFDILQDIRANPRLMQVPVIVLSNLGQKEDMEKAKTLGANKYLIKVEHDLDEVVHEIVDTLTHKMPTV